MIACIQFFLLLFPSHMTSSFFMFLLTFDVQFIIFLLTFDVEFDGSPMGANDVRRLALQYGAVVVPRQHADEELRRRDVEGFAVT